MHCHPESAPRARFDHERLDVYNVAIEFIAWSATLLEDNLSACKLSAARHLDAASTSVPLNIAEGNGKRSLTDRCRFLDIARGSALECAACFDVLVARRAIAGEATYEGKVLLIRVVDMLSKMIVSLLASSTSTSTSTSTTRGTIREACETEYAIEGA